MEEIEMIRGKYEAINEMFGQHRYRSMTKDELRRDMERTYENNNEWNFKESLKISEEVITVTRW